ncbi:MAG: molybdenum cofactor guanylyltransferase [Desulfovibrio sp.]|jgi:molybdopterin-guanine dinucleotide biosynthesis protein A|nr:molybdenum cofactor guanylyltransferase [Desulfovibrio sp.]
MKMPPEYSQSDLTGVALSGGKSSRIGYNKVFLRLSEENDCPTLLDRTMSLLKKVCGRTVVVGQKIPGYSCFPDIVAGCGPVGGITTALEVTRSACLVLACDIPFMEESVLNKLVDARRARPDGTLVTCYKQLETGYPEALVAIYEFDALPFFQASLTQRLLKIRLVIPRERHHFLFYSGEESRYFFNINTPAALETAKKLILERTAEAGTEMMTSRL